MTESLSATLFPLVSGRSARLGLSGSRRPGGIEGPAREGDAGGERDCGRRGPKR